MESGGSLEALANVRFPPIPATSVAAAFDRKLTLERTKLPRREDAGCYADSCKLQVESSSSAQAC
jgi:hypothetical protein